jgi:hypothetical protein
MKRHRLSLAVIAAAVLGVATYQAATFGQSSTGEVVVKVTTATDQPIRFRGAVMFQEGGLQVIDGQTPFEIRGRGGVALGMFERLGNGPEIQVALSNGQSSASGTAGRVIVGQGVVRGVDAFARAF